MDKNSKGNNISTSQKILCYPFNGRSSYLIDKFYIFGYDSFTLRKYLYNDENFKAIINDNNKKQNKINIEEEEIIKFNLNEPPYIINEITSDNEKECLDIDMIRDMIIPNKLNLFYSEDEKFIEKKNTKIKNSSVGRNNFIDEKSEKYFYIFDENDNYCNKIMKNQAYNVIFSSNPQSGNNSKKSINGLAYIFYKKLKDEKRYLNKYYTFYIPIIFCIISEFPYYNSFYQLCTQISNLFSSDEVRMPLEIIIYNILNITPSPLNADVYLSLKPIKNLDITGKIILHKISDIQEEDYFDDNDNNENSENKINEDNNNYLNKNPKLKNQIINNQNNISSQNFNVIDLKRIKTSNETASFSSFNKKEKMPRRIRRTVISKKSDNGKIQEISPNKRNVRVSNIFKHIKSSSMNFSENIINSPSTNLEDKIKFDFLTGYPIIQYNLAKILLQTLSPIDVIDIFLYTFLEKDVLFFSKDLEFLSLTINSYLNLNFPLNDEKYYFINACVSYDNYIKGNSTFVGSTFTTIIGINDSYNNKYQTESINKLKEHISVDLDKGKVYKVEDKNDEEKNKNNKELFNFIKNACKSSIDSGKQNNILYREINILNQALSDMHYKMKEKIQGEENILYDINKSNSFISYNENIKKINLKIQDSFYRFINNISLYFYQNLSMAIEADNKKVKKDNNNSSNNNKEEEMNVTFLNEYNDKTYSKEELIFLKELCQTMKFQSFVYGFVQSYNPIDLYKIPLTFTEEFISIISRKSCILDKDINFLSLIDKLYHGNSHEEKVINFEPILIDYYTSYKSYIDREIEDNCEKNEFYPEKIKLKIYNSYKKIIKYKGYELDDRILKKYLRVLNQIDEKEKNIFFIYLKQVKENIPKTISVTDIESIIENYAIDTGILSENDLCCANIIVLFTLGLKSFKSNEEFQTFLASLFQNFIVFRKYYSLIISMIYSMIEENIAKKAYSKARNYYYLYYLCINSLRNVGLIPNESLMNIIKKFNKIDIDSLDKEDSQPENKIEINHNIKLYGINLPEDNITYKNLYIKNNFSYYRTYKEKEIVERINNPIYITDNGINIEENIIIQPYIQFNNGIDKIKSLFYSQKILLSTLVEYYKKYIIDMDNNCLSSQIILDACLNIFIFMRNSEAFKNKIVIEFIDTVIKKIFYIFLNQMHIWQEEVGSKY